MVSPENSTDSLRADCAKCCGICCAALYFSASEGFPRDKAAGEACCHLQPDSRCAIYPELHRRGLKGCMAFDCFGAGQKVTQTSFAGADWRGSAASAQAMFAVFLIQRQLHEMLWYLNDALKQLAARPIYRELQDMLIETEELTMLTPGELTCLDVDALRERIKARLLETSVLVREDVSRQVKTTKRQRKLHPGALLMGADLRKNDLRGANLRGACLIAADLRATDLTGTDLLGADFRDTDIRGADMSHGLFLTQAQINAARGDHSTKLPAGLIIPRSWTD